MAMAKKYDTCHVNNQQWAKNAQRYIYLGLKLLVLIICSPGQHAGQFTRLFTTGNDLTLPALSGEGS